VQALIEMGCEQGQGFYFSSSLPARQLERLLGSDGNLRHLPTRNARAHSAAATGG
jgi:hypothetical protein